DLDDGLRSGMITLEDLKEVEIWQTLHDQIGVRLNREPEASRATIKALINHLVNDMVSQTEKNLNDKKIKTQDEVREKGDGIVAFSPKVKSQTKELKKF